MSETDRELLTLAARAAGIEHVWPYKGMLLCWSGKPRESLDKPWNPLADDGDALRLAAALEIGIDYRDDKTVNATFVYPDVGHMVLEFEPCGSDAAAATRRAIVRAAAALAPKEDAQ